MENWKDLYTEIATKLETIEPIKWIDLWHNQINFLEDEHPFSGPALFLSFRIANVQDEHKLVQNLTVQMDVYVFFETFADTFQGSHNQATALDFLDLLTEVNRQLHGASGTTFSEMRRTGMSAVDTGSAHNLYRATYTCLVNDESAYSAGEDIVDEDGNPVAESQWTEYQMGD
jgi:hypothetical protein